MFPRMNVRSLVLATAVGFLGSQAIAETPQVTAERIDTLLAKEFPGLRTEAAPRIDDAAFLRRSSLDLIGELPTAEQLAAFALDGAADKRTAAVERLLANPLYGQNWARYWRDVILFRRSDDRALLVSNALVLHLTDELNKNVSWDKIARDFITATGDVRDDGKTAIIVSQMGETADITSEVSRIFLGVQIQCAQCHNHPTDRWKREQFHELAAFFPRLTIRPVMSDTKRSFEVVSVNQAPFRAPMNNRPTGKLEHYMPDLNDPSARGTLMQPIFFATGQKLESGASDEERRGKLAEWITDRGDRWFAKALVNRLWSELIGQGFVEPVDDLGPDRKAIAPQTFDYLATQFTDNGYDVKWLLRTILATSAYQRQSRSRESLEQTPFVATCSQRLRADQLFNAVTAVFGIPESPDQGYQGPGRAMSTPRGQMQQAFGYDPSLRRDDLTGSIPQALWMMNSPTINRPLADRYSGSGLGQLVANEKNDEIVVVELYLKILAREPKSGEMKTCLEHVRTTSNRNEAFEDIIWALLNSTEFLHRR